MPNRLALVVLVAALSACSPAPRPPRAGPPSLGLDGADTYKGYLASAPIRFKMRHQVESTFGAHRETIEGFLVVERPSRFFVQARAALGPALFEVKSLPPAPLSVSVHVPELQDERLARYLARDIGRMYLAECPGDAPAAPTDGGFAVSCALPPGEAIGDDAADDALTLVVSPGADLVEKRFSRHGEPTATIRYDDPKPIDGVWLAHDIALTHASAPYRVRAILLAADLHFDTSRVLTPEVSP